MGSRICLYHDLEQILAIADSYSYRCVLFYSGFNKCVYVRGKSASSESLYKYDCKCNIGDIFASNKWCNNDSSDVINAFNQEVYSKLKFDDRGLFCVNDCKEFNSVAYDVAVCCKFFKSILAVRFEDNAVLKVFLVFGDKNNIRKWTDIEKNTFFHRLH